MKKVKLKEEIYNQIRNDIPLREKIAGKIGITERSVYVYATRKSPTLNKPVVVEVMKKHIGLKEEELFEAQNMNTKILLLQRLEKTFLSDAKSLELLGKLIRKEFDATQDEEKAFELLQLAYKYQIPQLGEMLDDYSISDFKWFM